MIRNLVFDLGNVLIDFLPRKLAALEQVPAPDTDCFVREVFGGVEWVRLDRGTLPPEEATSSVCARLPSSLHPAARNLIFHWWSHPFSPVAGMGDLLQEAKRLGYGIFLLSNATRALHDYLPRVPGADCLDGCIVSADWQLLKPAASFRARSSWSSRSRRSICDCMRHIRSIRRSVCLWTTPRPTSRARSGPGCPASSSTETSPGCAGS